MTWMGLVPSSSCSSFLKRLLLVQKQVASLVQSNLPRGGRNVQVLLSAASSSSSSSCSITVWIEFT